MSRCLDLFVFVDALGWRIAQREGFLNDLLPHRAPCQTVFGYSSTCDPTILTGLLPDQHGHFSFFVKAGEKRPFARLGPLGLLPHRIAGHHRVRHRVSRWLARRNGYTGYFMLYSVPFSKLPYLDYTEKADIYEPGGIIGGQATIFENWRKSGKQWMRSDWRRGDNANIQEAKQAIDTGEVELAYLFTSRLDAIMHKHGTQSPQLRTAMAELEVQIRNLHDSAAQRYDETRLYLFSDHGMADTESFSDMMLRFERLGLRFGRDYVAVWDSTMVRFWFETEEVRRRVTNWLAEQPEGAIVPREKLAGWGCDFEKDQYGELFYLLPSGCIFAPSFMNQGRVTAMHGYDPAHPDSTAAWLSNVPDTGVRDLTDIFSVMQGAAERSSGATTPSPTLVAT